MKEEVLEACLEFENRYSRIKTPDGACGGCCSYSDLFNKSYPKFKGVLLHLLGYRQFLENRHPQYDYNNYQNPDPCFYHVVCMLKSGIIVDVTNKQLDSEGTSFKIMTVDELKKEWLILSRTEKEYNNFQNVEYCLKNSIESIRKKRFPRESKKECLKRMSKNKKSFEKCFRKVLYDLQYHRLVLTGTTEDNRHLDFWNRLLNARDNAIPLENLF